MRLLTVVGRSQPGIGRQAMARAGASSAPRGRRRLAALSLAFAVAPVALAQPEEVALPSAAELQAFVVDRAAGERWIIERAARQRFDELGSWPRSVQELIGAGYLAADFSLVLSIGGAFEFFVDDEVFSVEIDLPSASDLADLVVRGTLVLPPPSTLFAPGAVAADPAASAVVEDIPEAFRPKPADHDTFWDKVANRLLVTRDLKYLEAVRAKESIDRDPVDTLFVAGPESFDDEAAVVLDKLAVVFETPGGTEFAGGVEAVRLHDAVDLRFGLDPSARSVLSSLSLARFVDSNVPGLFVDPSGQSQMSSLGAAALVLDSAAIEEADIEVLNGSAPVTRGQLDSFAVTQLSTGPNLILSATADFSALIENAVGPVFIGVSPNPEFETLLIDGRLDVGTELRVVNDAAVAGDVTILGDAARVSEDVRVTRRLSHVRGLTHTLSNSEFVVEDSHYFVPGAVRGRGDIESLVGRIRIGSRLVEELSIDIDGISLFSNIPGTGLSFLPNGETRREVEVFNREGEMNIAARGAGLVLGADSGRTVFRLRPSDVAPADARYALQNVRNEDVVVISNGRVGINLQGRAIGTYGVEPVTRAVPTLVVEGVVVADGLSVGNPGNALETSGDEQRTLLGNLIAGEVRGDGDVEFEAMPGSADPGKPFGFVFSIDDATVAYLGGVSGNLSVGNRLNRHRLSVGFADADRFYVSTGGNTFSDGDLTVNGSAAFGDGLGDRLTVNARADFASGVAVETAKFDVDHSGASGAVVRLAGNSVSEGSAALRIADERARVALPDGSSPDPSALRIARARGGLLFSAGVSGSGVPALGIASFGSIRDFPDDMSLPDGLLALDLGAARYYLRRGDRWSLVLTGSRECMEAGFSNCNTSQFLDGGNAFIATAQFGSIGPQDLQLITGLGRTPAVTVDSSQNITVRERVVFRNQDALIEAPADGDLRWFAASKLLLTSSGTVQVGTADGVRLARLLIDTTDTLSFSGAVNLAAFGDGAALRTEKIGDARFSGDVSLGSEGSVVEVTGVVRAGADGGLPFCQAEGLGCKFLQYQGAADTNIRLSLTSSNAAAQRLLITEIIGSARGDTEVPGTLVVGDPQDPSGLGPGVDFRDPRFRAGRTSIQEATVVVDSSPLRVVRSGDGVVFSARFNGGADVASIYRVASDAGFPSVNADPDRGSLVIDNAGAAYLYRPVSKRLVRISSSTPTGNPIGNDELASGEPLVIGTTDQYPLRLIAAAEPVVDVGLAAVSTLAPALASTLSGIRATVEPHAEAVVEGAVRLRGDVLAASASVLRFGGNIEAGVTVAGDLALLALSGSTATSRFTLGLTAAPLGMGEQTRGYTLGSFPFLGNVDAIRLVTGADTDWIGPGMLAPLAVTPFELGVDDGSVVTEKLTDSGIFGEDIAASAVGTAHIPDGAVSVRHLSADAFRRFLADGALASADFADAAVGAEDIADGGVRAEDLAFAIDELCAALGGSCVNDSGDLQDGVIVADKLAAGAIVGRHIDVDAVTSEKILDGAVTADDLAPSSVGAAQLAADAVGERQLAAGAVGIRHLSAGAVDGVSRAVLSPGAVGAEQLAAGAVTAAKLAAGAVGAEQLAAGAVGNLQLVAGERYDRITRVGRLEGLEVAGQIRAELPLASAAGSALCLSGAAISQCSSLAALKTAVRPLDIGLKEVLSLRARRFSWLGDGREDFGFVAEEVVAVSPLLGAYDADGRLVGVRYRQMSALLARALQQQHAALAPLAEALSAAAGRVGVGKDPHPDYRLDVAGAARAGLFVELSDRRLKRDVRALTGAEALSALSGVSGVRYRWSAGHRRARPDAGPGWQVGVIAQDVERALPELVRRGSDGYLSVSYDRFAPYLIEAVNALAGRVESLSGALSPDGDLRARSLALERDLAVGERFALRRSSTLASLLRVDSERRADDEVEGYLSARDVYLADRGQWWSSLDSSVRLADHPPLSWECDADADTGELRLVTSSNDLYVCSGAEGWWVRPMRRAGELLGGVGLL